MGSQKRLQTLIRIVGMFILIALLGFPLDQIQAMQNDSQVAYKFDKTNLSFKNKFYEAEINKNIDISVINGTIQEAVRKVADQSSLKLTYRGNILSDKEITLQDNNISVSKALDNILDGTGLEYYVSSDGYLLIVKEPLEELDDVIFNEPISGQVTNEGTGETIPGVNILVKGTSTGTATNTDGQFELNVPSLSDTLVVSYIGYVTKEVPINGRTTLDIELVSAFMGLDEVVVIGYGTQEKSDLTGSVSQIRTAENIEGQAVSNVNQALQGKVAGVQFTSTSGDPGAQVNVRVRGLNTFGDSGPLYIVDGLMMDQDDINSISPNDIESTTVLKDASASAIYGSRAANGVIIITTKSGREGPVQVNYNGYYGVQTFNDFLPLLNSEQYADYVNEAHENGNFFPLQAAFSDPSLREVNLQTNTDWQDAAIDNAPMMDHTITVSGGNDNSTYSVSGNYFDQESILAFRNLQRYQARVKTQFNLGRLTVGQSLILSRQEGLNLGYANNLDLAYMLGAAPTMLVYDDRNDSGYGGPYPERTGVNNRDNILGRRDMRRDNRSKNKVFGSAFASFSILPDLEYRLNLGLNYGQDTRHYYTNQFEMNNRGSSNNSLSTSQGEAYDYLVENTLTYNTQFSENYKMTLLAGYTQQNYFSNNISGSINTFPSNELQVISAGTGNYSLGGNESEFALRSYLGRANFTLFDKYLITATFRRDGSSRFSESNRFGNFPSFAVGWNLDRESFLEDISIISGLKLRASWGILGNQDIGNYSSQTVVATSSRYFFGSNNVAPIAAVNVLGNPNLKWEETTQTNVGLDLSLLEDKVIFSADYWIKDTDGILVRTPISSVTGFERNNGPFQNAAELTNKGFEFLLQYRGGSGDFNYGISTTLSTVRNNVTSLGRGESIINLVENVYYSGVYTRTVPGAPMSHFYGWVMDGIFQNQSEIDAHAIQSGAEPGDVRFRDIDGNGVVDANDRTRIGDPWPNFDYGVALDAQYKNFDFTMSLYGVQGKQLYNANKAYLQYMNGEWNQSTAILDRWQGEGTSNTIPRAVRGGGNDNDRPSTRFVENADFLRIQNLQVGYNLPSDLVNRIGARNFKVYVNVQNLYTFTGYDNYNADTLGGQGFNDDSMNPLGFGVDTASVPIPRTIQFGIDLRF